MLKRKIVFLLLAYLVLLSGCAKENNRSPVIARVGNSALTLDELVAVHPDTSDLVFFEDQIRGYVYRWVDREVLYQAAVEQNLEQNPDIQRELERLKRDLVIQYFLEKNLKDV